MNNYQVNEAPLTEKEREFLREFISQTGKFRILQPERCGRGSSPSDHDCGAEVEELARIARTVS